MNNSIINIEARRIEAKVSPMWTGDLGDDCTAYWAGFLLRAEAMDEDDWWYAATDLASGLEVGSSNNVAGIVADGSAARRKCEEAARRFLGI